MKIGPFGPLEIIIILVVILIIFGPKNLPKLGAAIGKAVKNLREGIGSKKKSNEQSVEATESKAEATPAAKAEEDAKTQEAEVVEVIDKPEPGRKAKSSESGDE